MLITGQNTDTYDTAIFIMTLSHNINVVANETITCILLKCNTQTWKTFPTDCEKKICEAIS